jgi:hypothetical protein
MAGVQIDKNWGYIDRNGIVTVQPRPGIYSYAYPFSNGLARVRNDREEGYIDKAGKFAIEPNFIHAEDFHGGLALVMGEEVGRAYIDTSGKVVYKFPGAAAPSPGSKQSVREN